MSETEGNEKQIVYWNDVAGRNWVKMQEVLDAQIEPLGLAMLDRAAVQSGESVLDVGCGCGQTSLEIARRVGTSGQVTGLDISRPMLDRAQERTAVEGIDNITFIQGDAQVQTIDPGTFDVVTSRFGVMFFADPVAAFSNLRSALKPAGRLTFLCWRPIRENPRMSLLARAVAGLMEMPPPPSIEEPGPFSLSDESRTSGILTDAGFSDVQMTPYDQGTSSGKMMDLDASVEFTFQIGPLSRLLAEQTQEVQDKARIAIRETLEPYYTEGEGVVMNSATWIVTAKNTRG